MAIELTRLSIAQRNEVFRDLARRGLYPSASGHKVNSKGATGEIISTTPTGVLIDGRPIATVGSSYRVTTGCAHGCPACPHPGIGTVVTGLPDVLANGRPIAVAGSETIPVGFVLEGQGEAPGATRSITEQQVLTLRGKLVRG
ncbi:MAG: PAAR domain-containing protein [Bryobacterales bacterium]|nr:PAAR domain-containing protein [Bryobacterales bacterium]